MVIESVGNILYDKALQIIFLDKRKDHEHLFSN
jgi:hypothetical protein